MGYAIIIFISLIVLRVVIGRMLEKNYLKSLQKREAELAHITVCNTKYIPENIRTSKSAQSIFVSGNVVISIDFLKRIIASLRSLFGGRIKSYTFLIERARHEAVLRLKGEAHRHGMTHVANLRLEASSVFKNAKSGIGSVEVYAYGTAMK